MTEDSSDFWKKCSVCKKPISFQTQYYVCSVSTCNGERTGYVFCTLPCFDAHVPGARHRDAGAIEKKSPSSHQEPVRKRIVVSPAPNQISVKTGMASQTRSLPQETLVIASRLKEYVQAKSEFNTSAAVMDVLSEQLRILCDRAIENARAEGRKTILDRDFDFLKRTAF